MNIVMDRREGLARGRGLALVFAILGAAPTAAAADSVSFSQYSWNWDGTLYPFSEWGAARLTYTPPLVGDTYLNLAINGVWQVENLRLMHPKGPGVEQASVFHFDLGNVSGQQVFDLSFDFSLTAGPVGTMPGGMGSALVDPAHASLFSGNRGSVLGPLPAPTGRILGGLLDYPANTALNFPNQQQKPKGCVPTAVSNSLKYLVQEGKLVDVAGLTSIETAEGMTGWDADGAWMIPPEGEQPWWETKKAWMESHDIPVTTRVFSPGSSSTSREELMGQIEAEREDHQDIEVNFIDRSVVPPAGHTAAIIGAEPSVIPGIWNILVVDDLDQEDEDNPMDPRWITYDTLTGSVGSNGGLDEIFNIVVECPEPGTLLLVSGGAILTWRRRRT